MRVFWVFSWIVVLGCDYKHVYSNMIHTHTHGPCGPVFRVGLSQALDTTSRPAHPEVAEGLCLSALQCFLLQHYEVPPLTVWSSLHLGTTYLKSTDTLTPILVDLFVYFWHEAWFNGLYCFCTDTWDSMLLCSLFWGSEPFCNFRLRLPKSFPSVAPYLCPSTSIIPAPVCDLLLSAPLLSQWYHAMLLWWCHPFACLLFWLCFLNLYTVRLCLLYFCVKSWHYKKHVKKGLQPRDWTKKKKGMMGRGLC